MNLDEMLTPFLTWQFVLAAVLINAVLVYVRRFIKTAKPTVLESRLFKSILTIANPVLGSLIAIAPGFLHGKNYIERMFVGVCAGFLSHFVYGLFIKRLTKQKVDVEGIPDLPASEADTKVEKVNSEKSK
jgi:hypothetical protein